MSNSLARTFFCRLFERKGQHLWAEVENWFLADSESVVIIFSIPGSCCLLREEGGIFAEQTKWKKETGSKFD